jgi:hypothetical protein
MPDIAIPYNFKHYTHQKTDLFDPFYEGGFRRLLAIWHRRAGKDKSAIQIVAYEMMQGAAQYAYLFPEFAQGRRVFWDGIDESGFKFLDHFPDELFVKNKSELKITCKTTGAIFQVIGTDDYHKLRGMNIKGALFSEYSFQNPIAWDTIIRPMLTKNGGWAIFVYTPNGKNHGYNLYKMALDNPEWHVSKLTADDTFDFEGNYLMPPEKIQSERDSGMSEEMIQQEFYCAFEGSVSGAYYGRLMTEAHEQGRVTTVPHDPNLPVDTYWDIGVNDMTSIWFAQSLRNRKEYRFINYIAGSGEGLEHYWSEINAISRENRYNLGEHYAPHDIKVREFTSGISRIEAAKKIGLDFNVTENISVADGIGAARRVLPLCWFDKTNCEEGINALENYRRKWDEVNRTFSNKPVHDWASHPADAFRMFAVNQRVDEVIREKRRVKQRQAKTTNPFTERQTYIPPTKPRLTRA